MPGIELKNLKKVYSVKDTEVEAVRDFSLVIEEGEFLVLVGPSGCGKSTILRMIAGLEEITQGELFIGGMKANDMSPKDRNFAMVVQEYSLYPHMTVFHNMAFGLKMRRLSKDEIKRKITEAADILDIGHLINRKPKQLSGGQRQRVALGRAMVRDPAAFLLDEPLSNMDAKLRSEIRSEIAGLHKRLGATFVYVTHDQTEAMMMGDRVAVMKDGILQQADAPRNLYENPANLFVAEFIGLPKMNLIPVVIERHKEDYRVVWGDFSVVIPKRKTRKDALSKFAGKEVLLGIRPENLAYAGAGAADADPASGIINAVVESVDMLGTDKLVYARSGEEHGGDVALTAKLPAIRHAQAGGRIKLEVTTGSFHLFDKDTGQVIRKSAKGNHRLP